MSENLDRGDVLSRISGLAPVVAAQHTQCADACCAERDAEAAVLEKAISAARPALRALSSAIKTGWRCWWVTSVQTDEANTYDGRRGVRIAGDGPEENHPGANRGEYEGTGLLLLDDGMLVAKAYSGSWSRWQGESSEWQATLTPVSAREAMDTWGLDDCLTGIVKALEQQHAGKAKATTEAAKARTEKLRALATLSK